MKQLVIFLLLSSFSMTMGISAFAQQLNLEGVWVLDSVQVKEVTPDRIIEKTVLPDKRALFDTYWMSLFKLDAGGKASYTEVGTGTLPAERPYFFSDVPYEIKDIAGSTATLIISSVPDNKILNVRLLSDNTLVINHSFITRMTAYLHDVEVLWKMYYHKSGE